MTRLRANASVRMVARVQARMKLARLLELPESEFAARIVEIEADPLFGRLVEAGVLAVHPFQRARFASRALDGRQLCASDDGLGDLIDGDGEFAALMRRVGQERFETFFLGDAEVSDGTRAEACGISRAEALALREFVDRLYVRSHFAATEDHAAAAKVYSAVGGVSIEGGRPMLAFFNREVWKGRYVLDKERFSESKAEFSPWEAAEIERFMSRLELVAFRQTTLFRVLEALIEAQAAYLLSGNADDRVPLTQRQLATDLSLSPSVLNRLIGNKSIELPWRLEAPLKAFFPRRKTIMRDRLYDLALEQPEAGDNRLRGELYRRYGTMLSRASLIQYRKELGLGCAGQRNAGIRNP